MNIGDWKYKLVIDSETFKDLEYLKDAQFFFS